MSSLSAAEMRRRGNRCTVWEVHEGALGNSQGVAMKVFVGSLVASLIIISSSQAALIGYWDFEGDFEDGSSNNYHGIAYTHASPTPQAGGPVLVAGAADSSTPGGGVNLNGTSHYVAIKDLTFSGQGGENGPYDVDEISISGWFNTDENCGGGGSVACCGFDSWCNWSFLDFDRSEFFSVWLDGAGSVVFSTAAAIGGQDNMVSGPGPSGGYNDGEWHHVAAVYDGVNKLIYVDGVLVGTHLNAHGARALGTGTPRFGFIGDGSEAATENGTRNYFYFEGQFDDIALFDNALPQTDVTALAAGCSPLTVLSGCGLDNDSISDAQSIRYVPFRSTWILLVLMAALGGWLLMRRN